jgi:HlyD family secretion protein
MSVRRSLIVLAAIALLLPVVVSVVNANQAVSEQASRQATISNLETYTVQPGHAELTVSALGAVEADEVTDLSFTVSGRVESIFVAEGDYVLAGDPILMLENEAEQIAYSQAILNLEIAHHQYEDTAEVDQDDIRVAEASVQAAWGAYQAVDDLVTEDDIRAAELRYQAAQQALLTAEQARRVANIDENGIALLDAQIGEAGFELEIARLELEELRTANQGQLGAAYASVMQAQQSLEQVRSGSDIHDLERARLRIDAELTDLANAEDAFYDTILTAPYDGVVSQLDVEMGQVVTAGTRIAQVTDVEPLHLEAEIDEVDISQVNEGMIASIEIDALDDLQLPGELIEIAPQGENRGGLVNYEVELDFTETHPELRAGMTAEAFVVIESREDVLVVPNAFIRRDRSDATRGFVSALNADGTLREIEVEMGLRGDDFTEILGGLRQGDQIARDLSGIDNTTNLFGGE